MAVRGWGIYVFCGIFPNWLLVLPGAWEEAPREKGWVQSFCRPWAESGARVACVWGAGPGRRFALCGSTSLTELFVCSDLLPWVRGSAPLCEASVMFSLCPRTEQLCCEACSGFLWTVAGRWSKQACCFFFLVLGLFWTNFSLHLFPFSTFLLPLGLETGRTWWCSDSGRMLYLTRYRAAHQHWGGRKGTWWIYAEAWYLWQM